MTTKPTMECCECELRFTPTTDGDMWLCATCERKQDQMEAESSSETKTCGNCGRAFVRTRLKPTDPSLCPCCVYDEFQNDRARDRAGIMHGDPNDY